MPDALVAVDRDGQIVYANDAVAHLFGWPVGRLLGEQVEILLPGHVRAAHLRHRADYLNAPEARSMGAGLPLQGQRRDGTTFPADVSLSAFGLAAEFVVLAAVRDMTERIAEAERALMERTQSQRLESLGQLAAGVAHDFNNLLGVILNYAALALRRVDDPIIVADLGEIRAAAELGAGLTKQLQMFARREPIEPEVIDVGAVVRNVASLLEHTLGEHIQLRLKRSGTTVAASYVRTQLEQILLNLALNARDAMPDGGVLTITVESSAVDLAPGMVRLTVTDTGHGMSEEVAAHAFEPLFTTKPAGKGTGLGLATVYGIAQQNGGEVGISSVPSEGTTVTVLLRAAEGALLSSVPVAADYPGGRERLLLVEDETALRVATGRLLADSGYQISHAEDGVAALEFLELEHASIDLVISDVAMPRMRGDELADQVNRRWPELPLIFVTGYDSGDTPPAGTVLAKPVDAEELLRAIREALDD